MVDSGEPTAQAKEERRDMSTPVQYASKLKGWVIAFIVVVAAVMIGLVALVVSSPNDTASTAPSSLAGTSSDPALLDVPIAPVAAPVVTYEIRGSAVTADLTYNQAGDQVSQQNDVALPRVVTLHDVASGTFLYVSAQNTGDTGMITCEIDVDGVAIAANESSGGYAVVSCNGEMP